MKLNLEQVELLPPEERIGETEPMGKSSFQHRPELIPLAAPSFCIYCFIQYRQAYTNRQGVRLLNKLEWQGTIRVLVRSPY